MLLLCAHACMVGDIGDARASPRTREPRATGTSWAHRSSSIAFHHVRRPSHSMLPSVSGNLTVHSGLCRRCPRVVVLPRHVCPRSTSRRHMMPRHLVIVHHGHARATSSDVLISGACRWWVTAPPMPRFALFACMYPSYPVDPQHVCTPCVLPIHPSIDSRRIDCFVVPSVHREGSRP